MSATLEPTIRARSEERLRDGEQAVWSCRTASGSARVVATASAIPAALRARTLDGEALDLRYYEVAAETLGAQFEHAFLILENDATGAHAVQPIFVVDQDLAEGLPAPLRRIVTAPRRYFPRWLRMRMLTAGCSAGEGALDCMDSWAVEAMRIALEAYAPFVGARLVLVKDFPARFREPLRPLLRHGFRRVPSMPACTLPLPYGGFEELLERRVGSAFRQSLRRKFRKLAKHPEITLEVRHDADGVVDEIYPLYRQTFERSRMRFEELTPEFFVELGRAMPDRARFFVWRTQGRAIGFALCLVDGDTLHDLNIGLDYSVALDLHLYFVTRRDLLTWAMEHGLRRYHVGPLNYHPKLHFGMELAPLDLYAKLLSPVLNPLFGAALRFLQPAQHDPYVRQFSNAHEL